MSYINERLLNDHLNIVKEIDQLIEGADFELERELYKLIVQHPEHIYKVFGNGYCTLTSIYSLLHSLHHWIVDDGEYCIVRKVNERRSSVDKRLGLEGEDVLHYNYSIQAGYGRDEDESCYAKVEDMIYLFKASIEALNFYDQNSDRVEGLGRVPYLERRSRDCYKEWRALDEKGEDYLEEKFKERGKNEYYITV